VSFALVLFLLLARLYGHVLSKSTEMASDGTAGSSSLGGSHQRNSPTKARQQSSLQIAKRTISLQYVAPWRKSKVLPDWMKEYFVWHQKSLKEITNENWDQYKYLVIRCLESDTKCGGAADRLKPLPFMLLLAKKLNRLLFYKWERPAALEEFLVPPQDGLDWRWPPHPALANYSFPTEADIPLAQDLYARIGYQKPDGTKYRISYLRHGMPNITTVLVQSDGHGMPQYNALRQNNVTEATYDEVFRDCWNSVFVPSPAVQAIIDQSMADLDLKHDQYHSIHVRSQYHSKMKEKINTKMAKNSVNCLVQYLQERNSTIQPPLRPDTRIFVATDQNFVSRMAVEYAHGELGLPNAVTRVVDDNSEEAPMLHLDRGESFVAKKVEKWTRHDASRYYDTFVDLYLLSYSKCMVFNVGNYGKWANLLSSDISCQFSHMKNKCNAVNFTKDH